MLIGLPGAGKSTIAPHAARLLESPWCDLDERVASQAGASISRIFELQGEVHFRTLERAALESVLTEAPQVIATGGGWAAEPGNIAALAGRALVVYLSVAPGVAMRRLAGNSDRPLFPGGASEAAMAALLQAREAWYRLADIEITTGEAHPEAVAASVATAARQYGGW